MDLFDAIHGRRSIRRFTPEPVEPAILDRILEAARWAPSWANTQCVRYAVIQDPALKVAIVETFSATNPARVGAIEAPILLVISVKTALSGHKKGLPVTDKGDAWSLFDAGLAVQNLTLAAHALGLGAVQVGYFDAKRVAEMLSLPADERAVEVIPIGHPRAPAVAPPRTDLTALVRRF
jgi:nitroreductase